MSRNKKILNAVFVLLIFGLTVFYVFHGEDLGKIAAAIEHSNIYYWIAAVISILFFIGGESVIIHYMMNTFGQRTQLTHCFLYSFVGFFFSCITPSATGGQPMQIYFMKKDKIPVAVSTVILMIVTITYKFVLVIIGVLVLLLKPEPVMEYLQPVIGWMYLGIALNVFSVAAMCLLVFHPTLATKIMLSIINFLCRLHILKDKEYRIKKFEGIMEQYRNVSTYFWTHINVIINVLLITIVQRFFYFFVTWLVYKSFGLHGTGMITIVLLQGMISVAVDMLPLPGGMGISERLFLEMFVPVFGAITVPALIVTRGLSFYTELLVSAIFTVVAYITIGKGKESKIS